MSLTSSIWLMKTSPQKAIRWYFGILFYQCLLSLEVFQKKNKQSQYQFKITASTTFTQFESATLHQTRQLNVAPEQALHL